METLVDILITLVGGSLLYWIISSIVELIEDVLTDISSKPKIGRRTGKILNINGGVLKEVIEDETGETIYISE